MGSQIMPPIMGAVAFIMAETINVPFIEVAKAALMPALLYFGSVFWMVHLEAKRANLSGLPKDQCPNPWTAVKQRWYLLIPLFILIYLLFSGRTPLFSGMVGLALTAIVILGSAQSTPRAIQKAKRMTLDDTRKMIAEPRITIAVRARPTMPENNGVRPENSR